jgi:NOL1/NOP2/fmu family ribosome biogenesis protein
MRSSSAFISLNLKIKEEVDELASSKGIFLGESKRKEMSIGILKLAIQLQKKEGKSGELRVESFVTYMNN